MPTAVVSARVRPTNDGAEGRERADRVRRRHAELGKTPLRVEILWENSKAKDEKPCHEIDMTVQGQ